jgi:hypothetical protein
MIAVCVNDQCPEFEVAKDVFDLPVNDVLCGECGEHISPAGDQNAEPGTPDTPAAG